MKKNILVLTGSPRKGGNTDLLVEAFKEGALEAGHEVTRFDTAGSGIKGCIACNTCFSTGQACTIDENFNVLAPFIEAADVLVLAAPLYWFTFPAQIKAAIDKLYAFLVGKRKLKIKECVLLACAGDNKIQSFDGLIRSYALIAEYSKWTDKGRITVPGVYEKGDIKRTNALEKARQLAMNL